MEYTHIPVTSCFYTEKDINTISQKQVGHPEAHFEYQMILVTAGNVTAVINQKTYELHRGSLLFISRLERHNFLIQEPPYHRYVISLNGDSLSTSVKDIKLMSIFIGRPKEFLHVVNLSDKILEEVIPLFDAMAKEYEEQKTFYETLSASILVAILVILYRNYPEFFPVRGQSNISSAVMNAQKYINDHFEEKITLQDIADKNYINRHTLSNAFKEIVGTSFKEYLILFRITEAKKLLITTDLPIEEIALQVGYSNVNNFIQIFKKNESVTPLQYRKNEFSCPID